MEILVKILAVIGLVTLGLFAHAAFHILFLGRPPSYLDWWH